MKLILDIWEKIKTPKKIWLILFYILFAIVLTGTLLLVILVPQQTIFHYMLYPVAAIMLTYFVYTIVIFVPRMKASIICLLCKNKITKNMLASYGYRTLMFSFVSLVFNTIYVIFIGVFAFMTQSIWYITITAYYLIFILMKVKVLLSKTKHNKIMKSVKTYKFCGIMFLLLTVAFSGIIVLIYTTNMYFEYAGLMIYAVAAYTFLKITFAIIGMFKKEKRDLYVQSILNINLVSSMISVLVLQVALFQAFSPESNLSFANALTGGVVGALTLALGIYMIIKANKKNKLLEKNNERE